MREIPVTTRWVEQYAEDRYRQLDGDRALLNEAIESAGVDLSGADVIDLAGGPGTFEVILAEHKPQRITYLDKTQAYLDVAKGFHRRLVPELSVDYVLGDLLSISGLEAESYDLAVCNLSLFYASDELRFCREVARILRPEGCFYLTTATVKYAFSKPPSTSARLLGAFALNAVARRKVLVPMMHSRRQLDRLFAQSGFTVVSRVETGAGLVRYVLRKRT